jgi:hypothetical protein
MSIPNMNSTWPQPHASSAAGLLSNNSVNSMASSSTLVWPPPASSTGVGSTPSVTPAATGRQLLLPQGQSPVPGSEEAKIYALLADLLDPQTREGALLELSKKREMYEDLALVLWGGFGKQYLLVFPGSSLTDGCAFLIPRVFQVSCLHSSSRSSTSTLRSARHLFPRTPAIESATLSLSFNALHLTLRPGLSSYQVS